MEPARGPAIEVEGLTKDFKDFRAVDNLSFRLDSGRVLGLLGPNGAGKTTTLHMLLGLVAPTSGSVRILGLDLAQSRREILSRVNFTSAYISMPDNLLVWENLHVFALLYGLARPRRKIDSLLELLEIGHLRDRKTGSLSSGQLTRVNLCKALLNDPEVLFLDEPTASLDPDMAERVRAILLSIQAERGATMVYTSHNMVEVEAMCDEVLFLYAGRLAAAGAPEEVVRRARAGSLENLFIRIARTGDLLPGGEEGP